jgi:predicted pyridoxine 5'-phosphate oxidase superfamily flavin-nucleotide-binding protein
MKRVVREQALGFVATVCPDGTPNLSPKGTTAVLDDEHLVFLDIRSPRTVENLTQRPAVEVNVVDPIVRKGYRFKGTAIVLSEGTRFEDVLAMFTGERPEVRAEGGRAKHVVVITVERALPLISPAYDSGAGESEVAARWEARHDRLRRDRERLTSG